MKKIFRCFKCLKTELCAMIPVGWESKSIPPCLPQDMGSSDQRSSKHSIVRPVMGVLLRSRHSGMYILLCKAVVAFYAVKGWELPFFTLLWKCWNVNNKEAVVVRVYTHVRADVCLLTHMYWENSRPLENLGICESMQVIGKYMGEERGFGFSLPGKCQLLTGKYGET